MASEIKMPALSPTMESGTLSKWLVAEGDQVRSGDIIAEIETERGHYIPHSRLDRLIFLVPVQPVVDHWRLKTFGG